MNTNMMIYQKAQHSGDVRRIVATNQPKYCCYSTSCLLHKLDRNNNISIYLNEIIEYLSLHLGVRFYYLVQTNLLYK